MKPVPSTPSITAAAIWQRMQNSKKYQYSERAARPSHVTNLLKQVLIDSLNVMIGSPCPSYLERNVSCFCTAPSAKCCTAAARKADRLRIT